MEKINTPLGELSFVGDLLSKSYPTTVVYKTNDFQPVVLEWLDEDDDGNDYFIIFKVDINNLQLFYNGINSHLELIKSALGKKYFEFSGTITKTNFKEIKFKNIDKSSLPKGSSYFDNKYSLDYELIANTFNINLYSEEANKKYFEQLKINSKNADTGLFRLHILEGIKIGHGTADTKVLGKLLLGFEDLYHEVALDVIRGSDRNPKVKNLPEDVLISEMAATEVYIQEAASFSIYLKSKVDAPFDAEHKSTSDEIFTKIDNVISSSSNRKELDGIKTQFSPDVFQSLISFTETVLENRVVVDLDYYNSNSKKELRNVMKPSDAHTINDNITSYSKLNESTLSFTGQFSMLNTKTGYFVFLSRESMEISGYVSSFLKEYMVSFNFTTIYSVTVTQSVYVTLNNKNRITYTLESCLESNK